jgi:NinB protein
MNVTLFNPQQAVVELQNTYKTYLKPILLAEHQVQLTFEHDIRTVEQNAQQWPYLDAMSKQIPWDVNGYKVMLTPDDWKDILTCAYRNEIQRVAAGFNGCPPVLLGARTSRFTRKLWPEWMEYLRFACSEMGVKVPLTKRQAEMMGVA